jgi:hypothetical protein
MPTLDRLTGKQQVNAIAMPPTVIDPTIPGSAYDLAGCRE